MDPLSAILLLGAGAAVAAGAQQELQAVTRTQALQGALGMATRPETSVAPYEEALPEESPELGEVSLWEVFDYPGMHVNLYLHRMEWEGDKASFDNVIHHTGYRSKGLGYWQVRGEEASSEPRSLWRLMQLAWLGRSPSLTIHLEHQQDGHAMVDSEIVVSTGAVDVDIHVIGDSIEQLSHVEAQSRLEPEDYEIAGDAFKDCFIDKVSDEVEVYAHYIELGHLDESFSEPTFSETMGVLAKALWSFDGDVSSQESEVHSELNEIAKECTDVALEEVEAYHRTYELEHGDEDEEDEDDEDEWEEDDD